MADTAFKIVVVDDQIGQPGHHQASFLGRVGRSSDDFVFMTGQNELGNNDIERVVNQCKELWTADGPARLSLLLLDVRFDDPRDSFGERFGLAILDKLRQVFGYSLPIVMLTTETDMREAANASAADGFLPKGTLSNETLSAQLFRNGLVPDDTTGLIGTSPRFLLVLRELRRYVSSDVREVLLLGETGSGKTDLARYLHRIYPGRQGPFLLWPARKANPEIHGSELFGCWSGAYTGADRNRAGMAELANRGTLFIDEIAELPPDSQSTLLEYRNRGRTDGMRRVKRLGLYPGRAARDLDLGDREYNASEDRILVDTVLVTATNQPIGDAAERQKLQFKDELFNRLGPRVTLPPLRERREDIAPLFKHYVDGAAARTVEPSEEVIDYLLSWDWREGNIAELKRVAESACARLGPDFGMIRLHHLEGLLQDPESPDPALGASSNTSSERDLSRYVDFEVEAMWGETERLRIAVSETRRQTRLGSLSDIYCHATGVEYTSSDVQRELNELLANWFAPIQRKYARWKEHRRYLQLAQDVKDDSVLSALYRYSAKELTWDKARKLIEQALPPER